jgi:hypothetical protein
MTTAMKDLADVHGFAFPGDQILVHIRRDPRLGRI